MNRVSIIVPTYNAENYIRKCLDSVLQIDYPEKEILVIDDGSTDATGKICDEYALNHEEILVWHKENGGVSSARNLGLDNASGEYIFFVDSDDFVDQDYVEKLCIKGDEDFVQGGCSCLKNDFLKEIMNQEAIMDHYARYWVESPCTFVWRNCYKRKIIEDNNLRFDEKISIGEDGRFNNSYLVLCKKIRRTTNNPYNRNKIETSAIHKLYLHRLEIEKEECMLIEEQVRGNKEGALRIRWNHWNIVLQHYQAHMKQSQKNGEKIRKKLIESYRDPYFRESLIYIRKTGSLDEKIQTFLMRYWSHFLYKPIMNIVNIIYELKCRCLEKK